MILFLGICAIFQFIYHHQQIWNEIEKSDVSEKLKISAIPTDDKIDTEEFGQPQCKIHSAFSNGHVIKSKSLEHASIQEAVSEQYRDLQIMSAKADSNSPKIKMQQSCDSEFVSNFPEKANGCLCVPTPMVCHHNQPIKYMNSENHISLSEYINYSEPSHQDKKLAFSQPIDAPLPCCQVVFVPRHPTMSSMNTYTTGFGSSLCSPNYPAGVWDTQMGGNCSLSLDGIMMNGTNTMISNAHQNTADAAIF